MNGALWGTDQFATTECSRNRPDFDWRGDVAPRGLSPTRPHLQGWCLHLIVSTARVGTTGREQCVAH